MLETNKELAQSFLGINGHSWKFQHNRSVDKKPQRARSWMWWCMIVWGASPTFWSWRKKLWRLFPTYNKLLDSTCYHHQTSGSQIPMGIIWPSKKMFLRFSGWIASGKHCLDLRRPSWSLKNAHFRVSMPIAWSFWWKGQLRVFNEVSNICHIP